MIWVQMWTGHNMGKKISGLIFFIVAVLLFTAGSFTINAQAASKPKLADKSRVTLYTDSEKYVIELKNGADNAKITYTSSDESVVNVKKGVVTPKNAGKERVKKASSVFPAP